jgi:hypothetical protein
MVERNLILGNGSAGDWVNHLASFIPMPLEHLVFNAAVIIVRVL